MRTVRIHRKIVGVDLGDFESLAGVEVSALADKIHKLANYPSTEHCLTLVAFYRLRQALEDLFGIASRSVGPKTPLRQLLPWRSSRERWSLLQKHLELSFPGLEFPGWLFRACLVMPLAFLLGAKTLFRFGISWPWLFGLSFIGILPTIIAFVPFARSLPPDIETLGDLAKAVLASNHAIFATRHGTSADDVLSSLRLLVACEVGVQTSEVRPGTRIPGDLKIY